MREHSTPEERRARRRVETRGLVRAEYSGRQFPVDNLSVFGAFIRTPDVLAAGTELEMDLTSDRPVEPIEVTALVSHVEAGGMGVQFTQFRRSAKSRLEELVSSIAAEA